MSNAMHYICICKISMQTQRVTLSIALHDTCNTNKNAQHDTILTSEHRQYTTIQRARCARMNFHSKNLLMKACLT